MDVPDQTAASPRVFISYSWDDGADGPYRQWVEQLAVRLVQDGVDARLDKWHLEPGLTIPEFMNREVRKADKVLVLCTPMYKARVEETEDRTRAAGSGWEAMLLTSAMFSHNLQKRVLPVLARGSWREAAPLFLVGLPAPDLSDPKRFELEYIQLLRQIYGERPGPPARGDKPDLSHARSPRPLQGHDGPTVARASQRGGEPPPAARFPTRLAAAAVGSLLAILVVYILVGGPGEQAQPPPLPANISSLELTVVLYGDDESSSDLETRRRHLARLLEKIVDESPRAIVLDLLVDQEGDVEQSAALDEVREALASANAAGVPVFSVKERGKASALPVCRRADDGRCVADLFEVRTHGGGGGGQAIERWPACVRATVPTVGYAIHLLLQMTAEEIREYSWPLSVQACPPQSSLPVAIPAGDSCELPWERRWVSEVMSGEAYTGRNPVTGRRVQRCHRGWSKLEDRVVLIGDPRLPGDNERADRHLVWEFRQGKRPWKQQHAGTTIVAAMALYAGQM